MIEVDGRVHFIGVGGAGMSAIAKVLLERGILVSGSDIKRSRAASMLEAMGAQIDIGHEAKLVDGSEVVVVSSAIPASNPELSRARELGLRVLARGEALAEVLRDQTSIVVAGTHGKTTTTSMIVSILRRAGRDPTYLVGGGLNDAGTNARFGRGSLSVAESDESDGSFLLLTPFIGVVTNIEADHLEYWGSFEAIRSGFARWVRNIAPGGSAVLPVDEAGLLPAGHDAGRVVLFGEGGDVWASDVSMSSDGSRFTLEGSYGRARSHLVVPGSHNVMNALAAAAACCEAGVTIEEAAEGLAEYRGVERRWQLRGRCRGVTVIDDYAHHPTEVRATLSSARPGPWERIVAVFQPHRYSRTAAFHSQFGASFAGADRVVVTAIYGAGEQPVPGISGKLVADSVCTSLPGRPVAYLPHRDELLSYLLFVARPGDALVTLGAGDISAVGEELLARLEARA